MNSKMMVTQKMNKQIELFIGSRKTSRQKSVWEDLHFLLPRSYLNELLYYKRDNAVTVSNGAHGLQLHCCQQCFKAHAITTAIRMGFDSTQMQIVEELLPGKVGHDGYYLNKDQIISL